MCWTHAPMSLLPCNFRITVQRSALRLRKDLPMLQCCSAEAGTVRSSPMSAALDMAPCAASCTCSVSWCGLFTLASHAGRCNIFVTKSLNKDNKTGRAYQLCSRAVLGQSHDGFRVIGISAEILHCLSLRLRMCDGAVNHHLMEGMGIPYPPSPCGARARRGALHL